MGLNTLNDVEKYFLDRINELENQCREHTTWVFLCAAAMINYLVNLVNGRETNRNDYKDFIINYMPEKYGDFEYLGGSKDLDSQMYHTLRCGMVHCFSLFPDSRGIGQGARVRSIALSHKENKDGNHLDNYKGGNNNLDSALFIAENFIDDIKYAVKKIFSNAKNDTNLEQKVISWINKYPPIMGEVLW